MSAPASPGCVLVALPDTAPDVARDRYLRCTTCSALVQVAAKLEPGRCPRSVGVVAPSR